MVKNECLAPDLVKQDYDRAIADYEAALRIDPNVANAKNNIELARKARGY
ncbi:hypothetical protein FACS1894137_06480 [Spirochaetia bacterium]|nr:hypothetical protein FACS1894137_06480 [Spirochaetia bacterium]